MADRGFKNKQNNKWYTKAPTPCAWKTTEEIPLKFNNYICCGIFLLLSYLYINKHELKFIKKGMYKKWEKICVNFSMLAGPFKHTGLGLGGGSKQRSFMVLKQIVDIFVSWTRLKKI
jgi:hypothetical protein